jgi:hypothetical protein
MTHPNFRRAAPLHSLSPAAPERVEQIAPQFC